MHMWATPFIINSHLFSAANLETNGHRHSNGFEFCSINREGKGKLFPLLMNLWTCLHVEGLCSPMTSAIVLSVVSDDHHQPTNVFFNICTPTALMLQCTTPHVRREQTGSCAFASLIFSHA